MALSEKTINLIKLNNKSNELSYLNLSKLLDNLLVCDDLDGVLRVAANPANRSFLLNLSYILFASIRLRKEFANLEGYNESFSRLVSNASSSLLKRQYRKGEDYLFFEFMGKRYLNVLKFYDEKVFEYNPMNTMNDKEVISFALANAQINDDYLPMVGRILKKFKDLSVKEEELFINVSEKAKNSFCKEYASYLPFSSSVLDTLSIQDKLKYFENNQKEGITYILEHFEEFKGYESQVISFLFFNASFYRRAKEIGQIILKFDDNDYLKELFSLIKEDELLINECIDETKYLKYFALDYKFDNNIVSFFTTIKNTNKQVVRIDHNIETNKDDYFCAVCGYSKCHHSSFLINKVMNDKKEEIESYINKYKETELLKKKKKEQTSFITSLNKIASIIDKEEEYSSVNKLRIETYFDSIKKRIEFKVGNERLYKILSFSKFVSSYKNRYEYQLTKDFNVVLGEELFLDREIELIKFMDYSSKDSPNIYLDENNVYQVLKINKGHYIYIDEEKYDIEDEFITPRVKIDSEGIMDIEVPSNFIYKKDYFISKSLKKIILISPDVAWKNFLELVDNSFLSILDVIDEFKYSVFIKYMDRFDIDESIQSNFYFEKIKIKSYFDFENEAITLKTKILRNDHSIEVDSLDRLSSRQYDKYVRILHEYGFEKNVITEESKILDFLQSDFKTLKNVSEVYLSEEIKRKQVMKFTSPSVSIRYQNGMMESLMESSSFSEEELNIIYNSIKKKKNYVLLQDDRIITLDNEEAKRFENIVSDFSLDSEYLMSRQEIPLYQVFKAYAYKEIELDSYLDNLLKEIASFKKSKIEVPSMATELRKYQIEGYKWLKILLKNNLGGILADDMGLGKTLQMITLIHSLEEEKPILIVTPKSLIYNWEKEFEKFAPEIKIHPVFGLQNERKEIIENILDHKKEIYITSYDSLRSDVEFYQKKDFLLCVLDEGQYIKNVMAKKTKSVKLIQADHRFVLTGTPIENNIIDLWSLFDFIMPSYLPPLDEFKRAYEYDDEYVHIVHKKVAPFILRRTKKEVLKDLPNKFEMVVTIEMNENQKKVYDTYRTRAKDLLSSDGSQIEILALLTRLRQICVDPSLFIDNYNDGSAKMDYLFEMIDTYIQNGHRLVIFSQFVKALGIVEDYLRSKRIAYYSITGETKAKDRVEICDSFNSSDEVPLCLVSLKAGGTGLNLVGADSVIHLDPWWNEAVINQATDRTYRIGQKKNVNVVKLICENSIEQKVLELQSLKKDLIDKLISDSDKSITSLTKEDIKFMLEK